MLGKHNYEHVLAKTRGLFSYQSNSLEIDADKITAHRAQRRVNCGWASSIHKPYRPLGTPDVIDKKKLHLLKQSLGRYGQGNLSNDTKGKKASKMPTLSQPLSQPFSLSITCCSFRGPST